MTLFNFEKSIFYMKKLENSNSAHVGWFIYVNTDTKKSKPVPRWLSVNGCWLEISQKSSEDPYLIINLGFTDINPLPIEESNGSNALLLTTNSFQGPAEYKLWTNNRFDIVELCDSLMSGKKYWEEIVASDESVLQNNLKFKFIKKSGLLTKSVDYLFEKDGLKVASKGGIPVTYKWDNIVWSRCNDNKQMLGIEISLEGTQKTELQFQCHDSNEMKSFLTNILYFLSKNKSM